MNYKVSKSMPSVGETHTRMVVLPSYTVRLRLTFYFYIVVILGSNQFIK